MLSIRAFGRRESGKVFLNYILQLWDLRTLSVIQEYKGHAEAVEACIFLPSYGRALLATCSRDSTVRIWDRDTKGIYTSEDRMLCLLPPMF